MNTFLKFIGGLALGAAIGAGVYMLVTKESEEGVIHDIKESFNRAIEEGKRSAEERRKQLEQELGFSVEDEPPVLPAPPPQPQETASAT
jgi:hypothetical protein